MSIQNRRNQNEIGQRHLVLVEGIKTIRTTDEWSNRH